MQDQTCNWKFLTSVSFHSSQLNSTLIQQIASFPINANTIWTIKFSNQIYQISLQGKAIMQVKYAHMTGVLVLGGKKTNMYCVWRVKIYIYFHSCFLLLVPLPTVLFLHFNFSCPANGSLWWKVISTHRSSLFFSAKKPVINSSHTLFPLIHHL